MKGIACDCMAEPVAAAVPCSTCAYNDERFRGYHRSDTRRERHGMSRKCCSRLDTRVTWGSSAACATGGTLSRLWRPKVALRWLPHSPVTHRPHAHHLLVDRRADAIIHLAVDLRQRVACAGRHIGTHLVPATLDMIDTSWSWLPPRNRLQLVPNCSVRRPRRPR